MKFLNPWFNPRIKFVAVENEGGNTVIQEVEGSQIVHDEGEGRNGNGFSTIGEDESSKGSVEDVKGDLAGAIEKRKARGMSIIIEEYPDDQREGWIDMNNRGVVYNSGHEFAKIFSELICLNIMLSG